MPPTPDLSFTSLDEFVNKPVVENYKAMSSEEESKVVRKYDDDPSIKEWVLDDEEEDVPLPKTEKKTVRPSIVKKKFVKSKQQEKTTRKTVKQVEQFTQYSQSKRQSKKLEQYDIQVNDRLGPQKKLIFLSNVQDNSQIDSQDQGVIDSVCSRHMTGNTSYLTDYEEINRGYFDFGGNPKGGKITGKVVKDDYSRFTWVFFLATKDETSGILKSFITRIENLVDHKVKMIRCDNGTEFKNREMNQFCEMKGILRQFSVARTPQQNRVTERRNMTLIKAARTMLADSKLPTTFWAEAVNTACYVQNRVCPVIILNTIDHLGKFDGKVDEGFFVRYSLNSKAFRVFNSRTKIVEENLHIRFSESTLNSVGTESNGFTGTKASDNAGQARKETKPVNDYIFIPLWTVDPLFSQDPNVTTMT
ncbi:ribonuclease H-like domain-containing protein [Tanacetum coccineum]